METTKGEWGKNYKPSTVGNRKSVHALVIAQCITINGKDNKVYEIKSIEGRTITKIGLYCDDSLVGYVKPQNKNKFVISLFDSDSGFIFIATVKFSDVTYYGEKLPSERIGHKLSERLIKNQPPKGNQ